MTYLWGMSSVRPLRAETLWSLRVDAGRRRSSRGRRPGPKGRGVSTAGAWHLGLVAGLLGSAACVSAESNVPEGPVDYGPIWYDAGKVGDAGVAEMDAGSVFDAGTTPGEDAGTRVDTGVSDAGTITPRDAGSSGGTGPTPRSSARLFLYGHSLVDYALPDTQVGTFICGIADAAGDACCVDGDYPAAFSPSALSQYRVPIDEPQHRHTPSCGEGSFESRGYDTFVFTETNFVWAVENPLGRYPSDAVGLVRDIRAYYPNADFYFYEHWPEMDTFGKDAWVNTHSQTFYEWFAAIQDGTNAMDGSIGLRMVPVGVVFTALLEGGAPLAELDFDDLFVDTAPHGTATSYFISGLVHYMAIYGKRPPAGYQPPASVHALVRDRFSEVVEHAWATLNGVADASGQSRVW